MSVALFECPSCNKTLPCRIVEQLPGMRFYKNSEILLKPIVAPAKRMIFKYRTRQCPKCDLRFTTVEIHEQSIAAILSHLEQMSIPSARERDLEVQLAELEKQRDEAEENLTKARDAALEMNLALGIHPFISEQKELLPVTDSTPSDFSGAFVETILSMVPKTS